MAFERLATAISSFRYKHLRQERAGFLRAPTPETSPLEYAQSLLHYLSHPELLPPSPGTPDAKPDFELKKCLEQLVVPLLSELPPPRRKTEKKHPLPTTQDWEIDDEDPPANLLTYQPPPPIDTLSDDLVEDVEVVEFQELEDHKLLPSDSLDAWENPYLVRHDRQSIRSSNSYLLAFHCDALAPGEYQKLIPLLLAAAEEAMSDRDTVKANLILIILLMFATGLTKERAAALINQHVCGESPNPVLSADCSEVIAPALDPHSLDAPCDSAEGQSRAKFHLPLPPRLAKHLHTLRSSFPALPVTREFLALIYRHLRKIANEADLHAVTLGRLRRTLAPMLRERSRDLVAVMHITRDTFGRSLAPAHYPSFTASELRAIYRETIWPEFRDEHKAANREDIDSEKVGSPYCPTLEAAQAACSQVSTKLHSGKPSKEAASPDQIAKTHNLMASHIAAILCGAVGHRPNSALFRLTIHDFDLSLEVGLFADKESDPTTLTRLAALGSSVCKQLRHYIDHLQGVITCKNCPEATQVFIKKVLRGEKPLIFRLNNKGLAKRWDTKRWYETLPPEWHSLQPNFGRHYIASRGRNLKYPADWIHTQLGHFQQALFPFSPHSPVYPTDLADEIGPLIDKIFKEQGWKHRTGFSPETEWTVWQETGPLRKTYSHSTRHRRKFQNAIKQANATRKAHLAPIKDQAELLLVKKTAFICENLSQILCFRFNKRREHEGEELLEWPTPTKSITFIQDLPICEFDASKKAIIIDQIKAFSGDDRALEIAACNRLAEAVHWARKRRKYTGPFFKVYRAHKAQPVSPFFTSIFRATKQIHALRELYAKSKTSPYPQSSDEHLLWQLGKVVLGLTLYGHIEYKPVLLALLSPTAECSRISATNDAVTVDIHAPTTTVGLQGVAALSYCLWRKKYATKSPPITEDLVNEALQMLLGRICLRKNQGLDALLQTVAATNRVELAPLSRAILDPVEGSVSLEPGRLRSLADSRHQEKTPNGNNPTQPAPTWAIKRRSDVSVLDAQVRKLGSLLPTSDKPVELPRTKAIIGLKTREYKPARDTLLAEYKVWASDPRLDDFVRFFASWLCFLLQRPKQSGKGKLKLKTVRGYQGAIAVKLAQRLGRDDLRELDVEDLENIYIDLLEATKEEGQRNTYIQLMSFHDHLVQAHGFEPVDISLFRDYAKARATERCVSNQLALPGEILLILSALDRMRDPLHANAFQQGLATNFRLLTQAYLCVAIAAATGARIGEIAGLKQRDIIITDEDILIFIKSAGYRGLKTSAARRLSGPTDFYYEDVRESLSGYVKAEAERVGGESSKNEYIFSDLSNEVTGVTDIRATYTPVIKAVHQDLCAHHLRHFFAHQILLLIFLGITLEGLQEPGKTPVLDTCSLLLLRQLFEETIALGHGNPLTSARCYFHLPCLVAIAAQARVHCNVSNDAQASALNQSVSGLHNFRSRARERSKNKGETEEGIQTDDPVAVYLDKLAKRPEEARSVQELGEICHPAPPALRSARLCRALDLLAQGKSTNTVRNAMGVSAVEIELLLEADRQQAKNTGIAIVPGNLHGIKRNSQYPRWRADSTSLQDLWELAEIDRDPDTLALIRGWFLAAKRQDRARLEWDSELIQLAGRCLERLSGYSIRQKPTGLRLLAEIWRADTQVNHELAFTLCIAHITLSAASSASPAQQKV